MPTISDYLQQPVGAGLSPVVGTWVQLTNNATSTAYVAAAATDANGKYTVNNVPAGTYTVANGPASIGPFTSTGDANYVVADLPGWFNVKDYGAKGDGTTDDTTAIAAALTAASAGAVVWMPPGTYRISAQLLVPYGVELRGAGRSATVIRALVTFPTSTALVRLGAAGSIGVGCRIRGIAVDCFNITSSTGIYSEGINENSGVYECVVSNYGSFGVRVQQGAGSPGPLPQNFSLDDIEIFSGTATGAGAVGLAVSPNSGTTMPFREISRITVFATGSTQLTTAIKIDGASGGIVRECHVENAVNAVLVGSALGCFGTVFLNITGNSNVTSVLVLSSATSQQNLAAMGVMPQGATNSIVDQLTSTTLTAEQALYALGNGGNSQKAIITTDAGNGARFGKLSVAVGFSPSTPAGATQAGQVFQGSGVPNNGNGNNGDVYFRTDTPGTANQRMYMKSAGSWVALTL